MYLQIGLAFLLCVSLQMPAVAQSPLVAVDVGHNLAESGAISARGRSEFAFNLDLAIVLAERLRAAGLGVREINFAGDIERLSTRPAQAVGSDFFLSIHHDSINESYLQFWQWEGEEMTYTEVKRGFGLFVSAESPDFLRSVRCAVAMGQQLRAAGFTPTPWHGRKHKPVDAENGVWYFDNLVVLKRTSLPAVLFEAGVIKHREEELELRDGDRQGRMSEALVAGLRECLATTEKSVRASRQRRTFPARPVARRPLSV
jgi:N-acetylmuramoyl-L-alanine amidase